VRRRLVAGVSAPHRADRHLQLDTPVRKGRSQHLARHPIDTSWPAKRQASQLRDHNWVFLRTIAMHETYPGHHLQSVHAKRQPSAILRGNGRR
jgi:hypothetical protein